MRYRTFALFLLLAAPLIGCGGYKGDDLTEKQLEEHEQRVMDLEKAHMEQMKEEEKAARRRR